MLALLGFILAAYVAVMIVRELIIWYNVRE